MEQIDVTRIDGSYEHPYFVNAVSVPSVPVGDSRLRGSWVKCNTDTLLELMGAGYTLSLPEITKESMLSYDAYDVIDMSILDNLHDFGMNDIVNIEYVGEEEVQCIEVADSDHMYITDDWIPLCNTSNIVFLKSTDDAMIDTLEKMSGKTHRAYGDSKMVTRNLARVFMRNEDTSSVTISVKEEPVIKYNDLAFINERNSIVFRAGDPPIWNRNELVLPMSWRLFLNKIQHPGRDYTLQTIPTLSSAIDFDVRKNQPDFNSMVDKRLGQAMYAEEAMKAFRDVFGYNDYEIAQLDPDVYADSVMDIIAARLNTVQGRDVDDYNPRVDSDAIFGKAMPHTELNQEQIEEVKKRTEESKQYTKKIYAGGQLSRDEMVQFDEGGRMLSISHALDQVIIEAFKVNRRAFERDTRHFRMRDGNLYDAAGSAVWSYSSS